MWWNYLSIPKLQRLHRWSLWMDKLFHPTLYNGCNYLSMMEWRYNKKKYSRIQHCAYFMGYTKHAVWPSTAAAGFNHTRITLANVRTHPDTHSRPGQPKLTPGVKLTFLTQKSCITNQSSVPLNGPLSSNHIQNNILCFENSINYT